MKINIEDLQPYLDSLTEKQKDKLLIRLLKKDAVLIEQLYFKHIATSETLEKRYQHYLRNLQTSLSDNYRAYSSEEALAKAITAAKKEVKSFTQIDKRPEKEADFLMIILTSVFDNHNNHAKFGTCWTKYDLEVTRTIRRMITLLKTKLHEDFHLDYIPQLEKYIKRIKSSSNFLDYVYELPDSI